WRELNEEGLLAYPNWISITEVLWPFRLFRGIGGVLYLTGLVLMIVNLTKTIQGKTPRDEAPASAGAQAAAG
ncbi:MAG: hypothetical protein KDK27_17185, partial [Leptospiraceae bacterium]|nr:hypothetical protein [Leptospiraceae bacterium]